MVKMISHVVAFETPVPKVYSALPPPPEDLDTVLAIMFMGPSPPTETDYKWLRPLLVRRQCVERALEFLILNHADYKDIEIDWTNFNNYSEDIPPVSIIYKELESNIITEAKPMHDMHSEEGMSTGDCPFIVHGLTGKQYDSRLPNTLKAIALKHWNSSGKVLGVG